MNWLAIFLTSASFLTILLASEWIYRTFKLKPESTRKLQHILSGTLASLFPWIFSSPFEVATLGAIMAPLLFILKKSKLLTSIHDVNRKSFGEIFFLLSAVALSFLTFGKAHLYYLIPILTLTFSDAFAAMIGIRYHKTTYAIKNHTKSFEGSAAFFITTFFTVHLPLLFLSDLAPLESILTALFIGAMTTVVEALCRKGIDNLLIPLSTYLLLNHLLTLPPPLFYKEMVEAAILAIFFSLTGVVVYKNRPPTVLQFSPDDPQAQALNILKQSIYPKGFTEEPIQKGATCHLALKNKVPAAFLTTETKGDLGLIGHYEALDGKAGVYLLKRACTHLKNLGAKKIIGPINSHTWNRYRLSLEDKTPFFIGEPKNPSSYPSHFLKAGLSIYENYESRITKELLEKNELSQKLERKIEKLGISIEPIKMENFETALKEIYEISLPAFQENPLFEPIEFDEFSLLYKKIKPLIEPDFVQLAYDKKRDLVGYVFAYREPQDPSRLIFKTLASKEETRASGLGVLLFYKIHQIAKEKGVKAVIHALMHANNNSLKLSLSMKSSLFRNYALYQL